MIYKWWRIGLREEGRSWRSLVLSLGGQIETVTEGIFQWDATNSNPCSEQQQLTASWSHCSPIFFGVPCNLLIQVAGSLLTPAGSGAGSVTIFTVSSYHKVYPFYISQTKCYLFKLYLFMLYSKNEKLNIY